MRRLAAALAVTCLIGACSDDAPDERRHLGIDEHGLEMSAGEQVVLDPPEDGARDGRWVVDPLVVKASVEGIVADYEDMIGVNQLQYNVALGGDRDEGPIDAVEIFLEPIDEASLPLFGDVLRVDPNVEAWSIEMITQEQQYEDFAEFYADDPDQLENVVAADLPPSYRFDATDGAPDTSIARLVEDDDDLVVEGVGEGQTIVKLRWSRPDRTSRDDPTTTIIVVVG